VEPILSKYGFKLFDHKGPKELEEKYFVGTILVIDFIRLRIRAKIKLSEETTFSIENL
jgi:hypothetical protein